MARGELNINSETQLGDYYNNNRLGFVSEYFQHMGMNGKAALYYHEQQTLEAAILLREMLASANG